MIRFEVGLYQIDVVVNLINLTNIIWIIEFDFLAILVHIHYTYVYIYLRLHNNFNFPYEKKTNSACLKSKLGFICTGNIKSVFLNVDKIHKNKKLNKFNF